MFCTAFRIFSLQSRPHKLVSRNVVRVNTVIGKKHAADQLEYIKSAAEENIVDWSEVKKNALSIQGSLNSKNIDAVLLKVMVNVRNFDAALSFADYLRDTNSELSLGSINSLLLLYYQIGRTEKLTDDQKKFILDTYKSLYDKYTVLDFTTCERLLHALCVIDEWKKAFKVLDNIFLSCKPSHSAYSTLIATLFRCNKKNEAMKLIEQSVSNNRPLMDGAYEAWINYILRKYKDKKTILKYMEDILIFISDNLTKVNAETAQKIRHYYSSHSWDVQFTKIRKSDGQCMKCSETLDPLQLTGEQFKMLQENVKEKLIVGSNLFLKTSPDELNRFLEFLEKTAPYDVVLDALNIAYAGKRGPMDRYRVLNYVVDYYSKMNKRILLLGRKHMLRWKNHQIQKLMNKTCSFFTEDLSQDDPFFITAAIWSGPHTDIVSKDLLRGHMFLMQDEKLKLIFRKWQWQHQWMVFINKQGRIILQEPLRFNPYAQKNNGSWHLPYETEDVTDAPQINDGVPDLSKWLCLRYKPVR
ncbi:mitochondrial ribonuclease P catalytic subunit [Galleria mellonella]|uniref:Mitochondrial ribonuclease P catalytic subunit n=1 Tax=Galleria mellonella TaxID=7137 RepID=A0ABM3MGI0_GALME|nr:mitochondrial ribonuclease P catalytic subunit [Galleria mellonella]